MIYYFKRYWKHIALVIVILIILSISFVNYYFVQDKKEEVTIVKEENIVKKKNDNLIISKTVFVDVKGAVNAPGVYEIDEGRRIIDQTCPIMIQRLNNIFQRNSLISMGI